jgi:xanthine dehydrogenase large subunit
VRADDRLHVRGESRYVDDLAEPADLLFGALFYSPIAHGRMLSLDIEAAQKSPGVRGVFTAKDVPGENQIGAIVKDEPLFAESEVHHIGMPIAFIVAETLGQARAAAALCRAEFEELAGVFDPRQAQAAGSLIVPTRTLEIGDVDTAWAACIKVVSGRVDSAGQEHLYLETQAALCLPLEGGRVRIHAGTQGPTAVQRVASGVLGLPMSAIEVETQRLGGGFGGKEDQATPWAVMAALAALKLGRAVKYSLDRSEDMVVTGKRHPYSSDYKLGLDADGKLLALEVTFFQNAGSAADLSPAILERSLFHATGAYYVPNARITGHSCRTNLTPFTAFRGFGAPQGIFVMESAMTHLSAESGVPMVDLQERNLLRDDQVLPFGMVVKDAHAKRSFSETKARYDYDGAVERAREFNAEHKLKKRGVSMMPICFGISFTNKILNQAGALVHIYTDGSVHVATGAVEMGQGVTEKIRVIAAHTLGVGRELVTVGATSTTTVANTSPTAASSGADLNGRATELACLELRARLAAVVVGENASWEELISEAYVTRTNLTGQAHYATPNLSYDKESEHGKPFAYHVFGAALTEVEVDCLRGTYNILSVKIVHDAGKSLAPDIDRGQVEGGLMQGIGWLTVEELCYSDQGRLLSKDLATYKVPDAHFSPDEIVTHFLEDCDNPAAVLHSKGIGEPPLLYGIGTYFAIQSAAEDFRPGKNWAFDAPISPERLLMFLRG